MPRCLSKSLHPWRRVPAYVPSVFRQKNREIEALRQHTSELEQRLKKEMQESKSAREKLVECMTQSGVLDLYYSFGRSFKIIGL